MEKLLLHDETRGQRLGAEFLSLLEREPSLSFLNSPEYTLLPGFCDVHVHFREPGFSYKETIRTGSEAAARGGYTAVCAMPNLSPAPDSLAHLEEERAIIARDAVVDVVPYGTITVGEAGERLSDMEAMAPYVAGFSDDGHGVQSVSLMRAAMREAKRLGRVIAAHCEDNGLLHGGCIHDGAYARAHGLRGICSASEYGPIRRDLALAAETGCAYHVCHISARESAEAIRCAKRQGVDVTCETAPHYLLLDENDLRDDGAYKMNPPLRGREDREALVAALADGTVDMIATDHAPHSAQEKSGGLEHSAFGIVGLECAFPALYTGLVRTGKVSLETLLDAMTVRPRRRFGIGGSPGFSVWALERREVVCPERFLSLGRATPFAGREVYGVNCLTVLDGRIVYRNDLQ